MAQNSPSSSSNAMTIVTGATGQVMADIVKEGALAPIRRYLDDIIHMEPNNQSLLHNRERLKNLSQHISVVLSENTAHSEIFHYYLPKMINLIIRADTLNLAQSQSWISKIGIARQIPELVADVKKLLDDLQMDIGIFADSSRLKMPLQTPEERVVLLHPIPHFVGEAIKTAENALKEAISAEALQVKSIVVYGVPGVGKTLLLQIVYNFYNASNVFDKVIWLTVSKDYEIPNLQKSISQQIGLDLPNNNDILFTTMHLLANLKNKKFLLILDDLRCALDLEKLGVAFDTDKGSRVVFSSRSRDFELMEDQVSVEVGLLTKEQGWLLFESLAFKDSHAEGEIKECAEKIAEECQRLPMAIIKVAKAMRPNKTLTEWNDSWSKMKNSADFLDLFTNNCIRK